MSGEVGVGKSSGWNPFIRRHWRIFAIFVLAAILAFAGSVFVFLWFVSNAQSSGLVPGTLGLWTIANLVTFILHAIFWELLIIGIPVVVGAVAAWQWWRRLPVEERREYRFGKGSRTSRGGGGVSFFFFLAFCLKVYIDGKWNVPIATFTLDYVVGSMVLILEWVLIIVGIPLAIVAIWWFSRGMRKRSGTAL